MELVEIRTALKDFCEVCREDDLEIGEEVKGIREMFQKLVEDKEIGKAEFVVVELEKGGKGRMVQDCVAEFALVVSVWYRKEGVLQKAVLFGKMSVKAAKNFKIFSERTAKSLMNLASVYAALEEHEKALRRLKKSLQILREVTEKEHSEETKYMLAINLFNIAAEEENLLNFDSSQSMYLTTLEYLQQNFNSPNSQLVYKISLSVERVQKLKGSQVPAKTKKKMTKFDVFAFNNPYKTSTAKMTKHKSSKKIKELETKPLPASLDSKTKPTIHNEKKISYINFKSDPVAGNLTENKIYTSSEHSPRSSQAFLSPLVSDKKLSVSTTSLLSVLPGSNSKATEKNVIQSAESKPSAGFFWNLRENAKGLEHIEENNSKPPEPEPEKSKFFRPPDPLNEYTTTENEKKAKLSFFTRKKNTEVAPKNSTCISMSKIELDTVEFSVEYTLKLNLSVFEVLCKNSQTSYALELPIPKNSSLLDYIKTTIEPCLYIKNERLVLEPQSKQLLTQGFLNINSLKYKIQIFRLYPRWKIQVDINETSEVYEMIDILNSCPKSVDLRNQAFYLLTMFMPDSNSIKINLPTNLPLDKIYQGIVNNEYLDQPLNISIFKVNYLNSSSFLIQNEGGDLLPLIVDSQWVYKQVDRIKLELEEFTNFFINFIGSDKSGQLILIEKTAEEKSSIFKNLGYKLSSKASVQKNLSNIFNKSNTINSEAQDLEETPNFNQLSKVSSEDSFIDSGAQKFTRKSTENSKEYKKPVSIIDPNDPLPEKTNRDTIEEFNKILIKGKQIDHIAYGDRIILRTCLYRNNLIYQVSMTISEEDSLNFYIRKGTGSENSNKFTISVKTLCEKTGIDRNYLIPLGSYVLRNMLTIKSSEICYFDFTKINFSPMRAIDKISSLLKGFLIRKQISLKLKNLVYKRKIKLNSAVYACLIYLNADHIYLRLVKSPEVLSLDLALNKLVKDGHFTNVEKFFTVLTSLGLKIVENNGKKLLIGLEKYRIG